MTDQATELRRLAAVRRQEPSPNVSGSPHIIMVTAGKGGVGTTMVALGLTAALASDERTTLLVDGNASNPDVATICGLARDDQPQNAPLGAVQWGPSGMHVASEPSTTFDALLQQLQYTSFDTVVIDAGSGLNRSVRDFWHAADQVVLVTGEDAIAAMDAYAAIKLMANDPLQLVSTVVNGAPSQAVATEIHGRIAQACQRFLGRTLLAGGCIPRDETLVRRTAGWSCNLANDSTSDAARGFHRLAQQIARNADQLRSAITHSDSIARPLSSAAA